MVLSYRPGNLIEILSQICFAVILLIEMFGTKKKKVWPLGKIILFQFKAKSLITIDIMSK